MVIIGMMAGGAFLFILIIGLFVSSISGPGQAPQTGDNQEPVDAAADGEDSGSLDGGGFQGLDGGGFGGGGRAGEFRDESFGGGGFGGGGFGGGSSGEQRPLPTVGSGYGQLPTGEFKDDYAVSPDDKDNNGFIDFWQGAGGF